MDPQLVELSNWQDLQALLEALQYGLKLVAGLLRVLIGSSFMLLGVQLYRIYQAGRA